MQKKITIAIDGFSSTGKSTMAKQLAKELGYVYVDTGAMYRCVAFFAMQNDIIGSGFFKIETLVNSLKDISIDFVFNSKLGFAEAYLNGRNIEKEIRTLAVSNFVSKVASVVSVREKLVALQKEMGKHKAVVMDGRDIGSVVFPDAELKLFITASAKIRAQRRFDELKSKGEEVSYQDIYDNVTQRDYEDMNRSESPLVKADDAIEIDNSAMTREEQFDLLLKLAQGKINS